jgi:modulator of FtsH protease
MSPYSTAGWENFFVAEVGAFAALTGLLFVAVSINLERILTVEGLPDRAAEATVILLAGLVENSVALFPGLGAGALGRVFLLIGSLAWLLPTAAQVRSWRGRTNMRASWLIRRLVIAQTATVLAPLAGLSLMTAKGGGLYLLGTGSVLSLVAGVASAWVLLIEIKR